jgi:hypothetical protein
MMVEHQVSRELGREGRAGDAHAKGEGVRKGTREELAAVLNIVDWIVATSAEEAFGFCGRRLGVVSRLLPHGGIERIQKALIGVFVPVVAVDDDNIAHDKGQAVRYTSSVEVHLRLGSGGLTRTRLPCCCVARGAVDIGCILIDTHATDPRDVCPDLGALHEARSLIVHNLCLIEDELPQGSECRLELGFRWDDNVDVVGNLG